jgi:hypothetical protein
MNIMAKLRKRQRRTYAKQCANTRAKASPIPTAQIAGISTLPTELWGLILEYVVVDELKDSRRQSGDLPIVLRHRLVCREFLSPKA